MDVGVELFTFEASTANVDDLEPCLIFLPEHNIFWLYVTMNDAVLLQEAESLKNLNGYLIDDELGSCLKSIVFHVLVQVAKQQFIRDTAVAPEHKRALNLHQVGHRRGILFEN